jgi:hypothetical protein
MQCNHTCWPQPCGRSQIELKIANRAGIRPFHRLITNMDAGRYSVSNSTGGVLIADQDPKILNPSEIQPPLQLRESASMGW